MDYSTYFRSIPIPPLAQAPNAQLWWAAWGELMDDYVTLALQSGQASFPDYAPSDGLKYIGDEVGMLQGLTESDDDFRTRLKASYLFGATSGTAVGILLQLFYQGYTDGYLIQQNGLISTLNSNPIDFNDLQASLQTSYSAPNDLIQGSPPYFAIPVRSLYSPIPESYFEYALPNSFGVQQNNRFVLYFDSAPSIWSGGIPTLNQLSTVQSIMNTWKDSSTLFCGIIIRDSGQLCNTPTNTSMCGTSLCGSSCTVYLSSDYT